MLRIIRCVICGKEVKTYNKKSRCCSISCSLKLKWQNKEYREKMCKMSSNLFKDVNYKIRHSEITKNRYKDFNNKIITAIKTTKALSDINIRNKISDKVKEYYGNTNNRIKASLSQKKRWANNNERLKQSKRQKIIQNKSDIKLNQSIIQSSFIVQQKRYNTYKKNNSFNKSKPEDKCFELLKQKFNKVERQYKSEKYPFNCDFYIPEKDLYIECNFNKTHNEILFNEDNKLHWIKALELLNKSREINFKGKRKLYYKAIYNTWVKSDPNKIKIAKQNNVNLIIFYNINKFKLWIGEKL